MERNYKEGDWLVHTDLRRMCIFIKPIGTNGCRIKLLTGHYMLTTWEHLRKATDAECKRGSDDVWARIEAENKFDVTLLNKLREKLG